MRERKAAITIELDAANPGHFFACCGLLELAGRRWPDTEGWFSGGDFCMAPHCEIADCSTKSLIDGLAQCEIRNTVSSAEVQRRNLLKALGAKKLTARESLEKKELEKLWRESPLILGSPFDLRVDWFLDDLAGGSRFKTWAGQQSVIDIALAMQRAVAHSASSEQDLAGCLLWESDDRSVPFNFDSNLGPQSSSLDVGYSLDALRLSTRLRPVIELAAFVGLQRFRPNPVKDRANEYSYRSWTEPQSASVASAIAYGIVGAPSVTEYRFSLLFRTKYLKSFLPATRIGASQ